METGLYSQPRWRPVYIKSSAHGENLMNYWRDVPVAEQFEER